jgi:uncharacterized protein YcfJ
MKTKLALLSLALLSGPVFAQSSTGYASVRSVTPQLERIAVAREVCETRMVQQTTQAPAEYGGAILGTVIGGVVGSRFGGGDGRLAATALGAGIGAMVGSNNDKPAGITSQAVPVKSCHTETAYEDQTRGYRVVYEYQGQDYSTVLARDPGPTMRVNVSVTPAGY